jgi:hypothetical protein
VFGDWIEALTFRSSTLMKSRPVDSGTELIINMNRNRGFLTWMEGYLMPWYSGLQIVAPNFSDTTPRD